MVALLGIAFLAGRTGVVILFALCSFAALREFLTLTRTVRADHWALAAAFFVVLPVQYWLIWDRLVRALFDLHPGLCLPAPADPRGAAGRDEGFLVRVAETQWALMIAVFCVSHVPALLYLQIPGYEGRGVLLIAFLVSSWCRCRTCCNTSGAS
jgi:phosphatidate cytidylyltransferase